MSKSIVEGSTDKALPLRSKYGRMCGHASKHELHLVTYAAIARVYMIMKPLITEKCPFVNLPGTGRARWGEILDAEKMRKCVWVRPKLVAVVEFLEWTQADRLRHSKFVALRDDKNTRRLLRKRN